MIRSITKVPLFLGFNWKTFRQNLSGLSWFFRDYFELRRQLGKNSDFRFGKWYPMLTDKYEESGNAQEFYFYQDLLVAQRIFEKKPEKHVDIGSRVDGFIAHVASFRKIELFDIRPLGRKISNVRFVQADLMQLPPALKNYTDSLSCLHVVEHFGLGRYNDPIDANGHIKAIHNMHQILRPGGTFYFSVPIGPQRIEFNAHRVFGLRYLLELLEENFELQTFSYIDDHGNLFTNYPLSEEAIDGNCGCRYGCGIFELVKN